MQSLGLDVAMPSFLDGKRQLSAEEANQSRCITKVRLIVEAANRRIKQFKYFANTVQNSSLIYLERDLSIACALINCHHPPTATSKPEDREIGGAMIELLQQKNRIKTVDNYQSKV
jgi:DDE superfamily endonuclease